MLLQSHPQLVINNQTLHSDYIRDYLMQRCIVAIVKLFGKINVINKMQNKTL